MCSKLDINVPQNRERLIIVGIKKDLNQTFDFIGAPGSKFKLDFKNFTTGCMRIAF